MTDRIDHLENRLRQLEKRNKIFISALTAALAVLAASAIGGWAQAQQQPADQVLRARGLIIEDTEGRPRIMLGSPIADRNVRSSPRTGMIINDSAGVERFGLGLNNAGTVVMGFDAPLGKGDDRNRERITIVADGEGGAALRFKDRRTLVGGQFTLDDDNTVWLEFLDIQPKEVTRRRIGFSGEQKRQEQR